MKLNRRCNICGKVGIAGIDFTLQHCRGSLYYLSKCNACLKEYKNKWAAQNREKKRQYSKKYYLNNKEKVLKWHRNYRDEHRELILERKKRYYHRNKKKIEKFRKEYTRRPATIANRRKNENKRTKLLYDSYLRGILKKRYDIKEIPKELIELKRDQIELYRIIKKAKEVLNDTIN